MKFFSSKNQWIIGLDQGRASNEAIILEETLPVRKWESKNLKKINDLKEVWETECTYMQYKSGAENIFICITEEIRIEPGHIRSINEMFVDQQYVEEKVQQLRDFNYLAVYNWDSKNNIWIEVERLFEEEDDDVEEDKYINVLLIQ